jgi:hypothetical protein
MKNRISSNGGPGRRGWSSSGSVAPTLNKIRIDRHTSDFTPLSAYPPNGPSCRVLPTSINTCVYAFSPTELDLMFSWIPLPSKFWNYKLTAPTGCDLRFYWYTDNTSANIVCWRAELVYVRNGETCNFAPPALQVINVAAGTQYNLNVTEILDFPITNPTGSAAETEGMFYLKMGRDGAAAEDTFGFEAYVLGASIDIPLK